MNVPPYWGSTNISNHRNVFCSPGDLALEICRPLFEMLSFALRLFKSRVSVSVLQSVTLWHGELLYTTNTTGKRTFDVTTLIGYRTLHWVNGGRRFGRAWWDSNLEDGTSAPFGSVAHQSTSDAEQYDTRMNVSPESLRQPDIRKRIYSVFTLTLW